MISNINNNYYDLYNILSGDIPKLSQLERLSINRNRIKSIDWTSFVRMKSLSLVKLWQDNPIKCDCNTLELIKFVNVNFESFYLFTLLLHIILIELKSTLFS